MGEETTDEIELNMAGLAMFPCEWAGVFAADETPPKRGYCIQNTAARSSGSVHWLARANGLVYDSYGRRKYGDLSGDAEQKRDETTNVLWADVLSLALCAQAKNSALGLPCWFEQKAHKKRQNVP